MMKQMLSLILISMISLPSTLVRADESSEDDEIESQEITLVESELKHATELTDADIFDQISEISTINETITTPEQPSEKPQSCMDSYQKRRKQLLRKSIVNVALAPFGIAGATVVVGAYGGSYVGPILTGSKGYGAILGSAWGAVIMFYGSATFFTAREAILITEYFQLHRMIILLDEIRSSESDQELKLLNKMHESIEKSGSKITLAELRTKLIDLDLKGQLCDGSLRGNKKSTKLRKKLVGFHRLKKILSQ